MVEVVQDSTPAKIGSVMAPTGCTTSSKNPFSGVGKGCNLLGTRVDLHFCKGVPEEDVGRTAVVDQNSPGGIVGD